MDTILRTGRRSKICHLGKTKQMRHPTGGYYHPTLPICGATARNWFEPFDPKLKVNCERCLKIIEPTEENNVTDETTNMTTEDRKALTIAADKQAVFILKQQAFKTDESGTLRDMLAKAYESGFLTAKFELNKEASDVEA